MHTTSQTDYIVVKISSNDVVNNDALGNYYTHKFHFTFLLSSVKNTVSVK